MMRQLGRFVLAWLATFTEKRGRTILPVFGLMGLSGGIEMLVLDHPLDRIFDVVIRILLVFVVSYTGFRLVDAVIEFIRQIAVRSGSTLNNMLIPTVSTSLRLTIGVLALLEITTILGDQPPSSVIAGLGAAGLAAQDTIKNFFGSVMIFADRPFELGDRRLRMD